MKRNIIHITYETGDWTEKIIDVINQVDADIYEIVNHIKYSDWSWRIDIIYR